MFTSQGYVGVLPIVDGKSPYRFGSVPPDHGSDVSVYGSGKHEAVVIVGMLPDQIYPSGCFKKNTFFTEEFPEFFSDLFFHYHQIK